MVYGVQLRAMTDNKFVSPNREQTFEADPETELMLLESIAQADLGQTVPLEKVLDELRSRE